MVADLEQYYKSMGCNMSLQVNFLDSHLDFLPENLRVVSDEHGHFHHGKSVSTQVESQYAG
jgi:hypothetical protein